MIPSPPCQSPNVARGMEPSMRRRKQYQRGSLKRRSLNGRDVWLFQFREDGQSKSKLIGECAKMTRGEAERECTAIRERINAGAGQPVGEPSTFGSFVESVYLPLKKRKWKAGSTAITSEADIQRHLVAELSGRSMRSITRSDLQDLLDRKAAAKLSLSVVKHIRFHLSGIFKVAMGDGVVSRNPTTGLQNPVCVAAKHKGELAREQVIVIDQGLPLRERLVFRLGVIEGMRPGEMFGLKQGDIESRELRVRRRVYHGDIDTPKTAKSARKVALSEPTALLLAQWIDLQRAQGPDAWVFQSENVDTPIDHCNFLSRWFKPKLKDMGFGWVDFRVLRRTQSSLGDDRGLDRKVMADQRGHGADTALEVYITTGMARRQDAVQELSDWLQ